MSRNQSARFEVFRVFAADGTQDMNDASTLIGLGWRSLGESAERAIAASRANSSVSSVYGPVVFGLVNTGGSRPGGPPAEPKPPAPPTGGDTDAPPDDVPGKDFGDTTCGVDNQVDDCAEPDDPPAPQSLY